MPSKYVKKKKGPGCPSKGLARKAELKNKAYWAEVKARRQTTATNLSAIVKKEIKEEFPSSIPAQDRSAMSAGPRITLRGLTRARSTLYDFVSSYFMFHGLDPTKTADVFAHLPALTFTEAVIYELDDANECAGRMEGGETRGGSGTARTLEQLVCRLEEHFGAEHFRRVRSRLQWELSRGSAYWETERRLCGKLAAGTKLTDEDARHALDALKKKSFDYRVLNLVLLASVRKQRREARDAERRRRGTGCEIKREEEEDEEEEEEDKLGDAEDVPYGDLLAASELLVELSDDLYDYEEDVASGAFNFYRCLVNRHGPERAPEEMAAVIQSAEREYARLEERLSVDDPELARRYRERCAQATEEGLPGRQVRADPSSPAEMTVDSRGKWEMPPPIADERAWRERTDDVAHPRGDRGP